MKRPLIFILVALLAGEFLGDRFCINTNILEKIFVYLMVTFLIFFCVIIILDSTGKRKRLKKTIIISIKIISVILFLVIGIMRISDILLETEKFEDMVSDKEYYNVTGKVDNIINKNDKDYYYLSNIKINDKEIKKVKVIISSEYILTKKIGIILSVQCMFMEFRTPANEGEFDELTYYRQQNIVGRFYVFKDDIQNAYYKESREYNEVDTFLFEIRKKVFSTIDTLVSTKNAGILKAMVLGNKEELDEDVKDLYKNTGVSHLLVVSGMHISLLGLSIYRLLRKKFRYALSGVISVGMVIVYLRMIGDQTSALRAVIMFGLIILADYFGRTYDILSALSMSLLLLNFDMPFYIASSSAQMSFGSVLAITIIFPIIKLYFRIKRKTVNAFLLSECINIVLRPIMAINYYEITVYSSFANIIMVPLMGIAVTSTFFAIFLSLISVNIGMVIILPAVIVLWLYQLICNSINKLPFAVLICGYMKMNYFIFYYLIIFFLVVIINVYLRVKENSDDEEFWKIKYIKRVIAAAIYIILFLMIVIRRKESVIKMIDVGQGDSFFFENDEKTFLVDAGSSSKNQISEYTIIPFLKYNGVSKLDYLILTHSDSDHTNGAIALIKENMIRCLIIPDIDEELMTDEFKEIIRNAEIKNVKILHANDELSIKGKNMELEFISPSSYLKEKTKDVNEMSIVFKLRIKNVNMLFTGDLGNIGENILLTHNKLSDIDILKVGHHGSSYSSGEEFLNILKPELSLISCGLNNRYGHPGKDTIERLQSISSLIYCTKDIGELIVHIKEQGFYVEKYK